MRTGVHEYFFGEYKYLANLILFPDQPGFGNFCEQYLFEFGYYFLAEIRMLYNSVFGGNENRGH